MTERINLTNGMPILYHPMEHSPTTTILILVKVGSRYENDSQRGISHFLEHMMFKGTKKRPDSQSIATKLDELGASYNAFTGFEYTGYWIKVANHKTEIAMDILSDIFQNSLFQEKDIETERGAILEEMNMIADTPSRQVMYAYQELLYGDTPLGRSIVGTRNSVKGFKREDFVNYFFGKYSSQNSLFVISGGVDRSAVDTASSMLSHLRSAKAPQYEEASLSSEGYLSIQEKDTDQVHLAAGVPTHGLRSDEKYAGELVSTLLGGYMSSRLFREIREKRGLAYYAAARSNEHEDVGSMVFRSGIQVGKTAEVIEIISDQIRNLAHTMTEEEFLRAKEHTKGSISIAFETSDRIAMEIAFRELFLGESFDISRELSRYDEVTFDHARNYAQKYFVDTPLYIATIGKVSDDERAIMNSIIKN
jgi:predicted Zn-dependent peptidase